MDSLAHTVLTVHHPRPRVAVSLMLPGLLFLAGVSIGLCRAGEQPPDQLAWIGRLPADTGAIVVVDNASRLSREPSGRAAAHLLEEIGLLKATSAAWGSLAGTLGLDGQAAFDALLGTRAAILLSSMDAADEPQWAALAVIDKPTEARLRNGLRPAPRGFVLGHHVMAVEDGRYELVLHPGPDRHAGTLLVLAPAGGTAFFDSVLASVSGQAAGAATLDQLPCWDMIKSIGGGHILAVFRQPADPNPDPAHPVTDRFSAFAATVDAEGFTARVVGELDAAPAEGAEDVPSGWFDMVGQQFAQSALILMSATRQSASGSAAESVTALLSEWLGIPEDLYSRLGPGVVLAMEPLPDPEPPPQGEKAIRGIGFAMTLGVEVQGEDAIAACDTCMARLLAPPGLTDDSVTPAMDFRGEFPGAVRVMDIPVDPPSRLSALLGARGSVAWSFTPLTPRQDEIPPRGWWIVRIFPGSDGEAELARVRKLDAVLAARPAEGARNTRVMSFTLKPALLQRALSRGGLLSVGPLGAIRWIERIDWDTRLVQPGVAQGELKVRMNLKLLDDPTKR